MRLRRFICISALFLSVMCGYSLAQDAKPVCGVPPVADPHAQPNIFSEQQEEWLGDAMADQSEAEEFRPVSDPALTAHLQAIVDKLAATLPQTKIRFRVMLVDSSEVNGASMAGGHIYLTRKLAAVAQNDDELASVLGHEIGHIASHQFAFETTRDLKRLLNITAVGDRADIYAKWQQLTDARMKDKHLQPGGDDDSGQDEADRIGVYVAAAAGYRPQAEADFWNRVFFVEGKTGSKLSDFFRITKPDQKRLRGILALVAALPKGCGAEKSEPTPEFTEWHKAVVANQAVATSASPALREVTLTPALHLSLDRLRFSPDGKMILAQDEASIFVLTREPFAVKFRIDAVNALPASFSPDSSKITFSTPGLHVEEWSIAEQKLISAQEILLATQCFHSALAPDGRTLLCMGVRPGSSEIELDMVDVATGKMLWQKKPFAAQVIAQLAPMHFSPDGNLVIVGLGMSKVALDLRTRTPMDMARSIGFNITGDYAFLGNDKIVGESLTDRRDGGIYSFPDGKRLQWVALSPVGLESVAASDSMVLGYGFPDYGVGVVNVTNDHFIGLKTRTADVWNDVLVYERFAGTLSLIKVGSTDKPQDKELSLPLGPLGRARGAGLSGDGSYLALSTLYRGGVWDVESGRQVLASNGFSGSQWAANDTVYLDISKLNNDPRHVARLTVKPPAVTNMPYTVDNKIHMRYNMLMEWKTAAKGLDLVIHDPASGGVIWSRNFLNGEETYTASYGWRDLIFNYPLQNPTAKEHLKANPSLAAEAATLKNKKLGRVIEVLDTANGKTVGEVVLELPLNFSGTDGLNRMGDLLFVSGRDNRTMTYSLETGKQLRQIFGYVMAIDPESKRICTVNRQDEAVVYDEEGKELAHYHMGSPLRFAQFREKGSRLVVLTADQKVRVMDLSKPMETAAN